MSGSSSDSDSGGDHRKRRHRDKKEKKKHHKKEKRHKSDKKPADEGKKIQGDICVEPISEADYFLKTREFQQWLTEARQTFLDEVSSEEARRLFKKFVSKWNAGELDMKLYASTISTGAPAASRTRHQWSFVSKLTDADQLQLDRAADASRAQTNLSGSRAASAEVPAGRAAGGTIGPSAGPVQQPARNPSAPRPPSLTAGPPAAIPGSRLAELQAKEAERMASFRRQMGL